MNIDTINRKDPELGDAISTVLKCVQLIAREPLIRVINDFTFYSNKFTHLV